MDKGHFLEFKLSASTSLKRLSLIIVFSIENDKLTFSIIITLRCEIL